MNEREIKKYRIPTTRLQSWDYTQSGLYFITFCTFNKKCLFGEVNDEQMHLNKLGFVIDQEWLKSFEIRNELACDCYIIMPNHLHSIIQIERDDKVVLENLLVSDSTKLYRRPKSISSFAAGFKSVTTNHINKITNNPTQRIWQPGYYDHIIRNDDDLKRIREYIVNNAIKWELDRYYKSKNNDFVETHGSASYSTRLRK